MNLLPELIDLVREVEGFRSKAYRCPAGVWTIGYGHTENVHEGDIITVDAALCVLHSDLRAIAKDVKKAVKVPLDDWQLSALISFTFNVGIGALRRSTLLIMLNNRDYTDVPEQLVLWNKATVKGKKIVLPGLVTRRAKEVNLWLHSQKSPIGMPQSVSR